MAESEEKYPLLFLYVDDGKGNTTGPKKMFINKNRFSEITTGATTVITQWPGHLASCWLASLLCGLTLLMLTLILFAATSHQQGYIHNPKCIGSHVFKNNKINNQTIHLVHDSDEWSKHQIEILEEILENFKNYTVHILVVANNTQKLKTNYSEVVVPKSPRSPTVLTRIGKHHSLRKSIVHRRARRAKKRLPKKSTTDSTSSHGIRRKRALSVREIHIGTNHLLKRMVEERPILVSSEATTTVQTTTKQVELHDLEVKNHNILVETLSFQQVFEYSPLHGVWKNLNNNLRLFATRVLFLWQYGGISYALPKFIEDDHGLMKSEDVDQENIIKTLIYNGPAGYALLPKGIVTIDDEGLHMQTKSSCHAFFGDILGKLNRADGNTTVPTIIKSTLKGFCKRGAADLTYCTSLAV